MRLVVRGVGVLALLACRPGVANASFEVLYTLNDSTNQVSATALFQSVSGGIEITVTNTELNTPDAGHAISQIQFTVGGSLKLPTAFTELKGMTTDFVNSPTAIDVSPTSAQHWYFSSSPGSLVSLWTVDGNGLNGYGGQPNHLIVAAGSTANSSLTGPHLPSFVGPVHFFLADSQVPAGGLTTKEITGVRFSFGTGPEVNLEAALSPVPEPDSLTLFGIGAVSLISFWSFRRKQIPLHSAC
jgi:hypothetical protein